MRAAAAGRLRRLANLPASRMNAFDLKIGLLSLFLSTSHFTPQPHPRFKHHGSLLETVHRPEVFVLPVCGHFHSWRGQDNVASQLSGRTGARVR
jgi:hypothetical protein